MKSELKWSIQQQVRWKSWKHLCGLFYLAFCLCSPIIQVSLFIRSCYFVCENIFQYLYERRWMKWWRKLMRVWVGKYWRGGLNFTIWKIWRKLKTEQFHAVVGGEKVSLESVVIILKFSWDRKLVVNGQWNRNLCLMQNLFTFRYFNENLKIWATREASESFRSEIHSFIHSTWNAHCISFVRSFVEWNFQWQLE